MRDFLGKPFSNMIKYVADVRKEIIALGGELHSDAEAVLLENGSNQADLWGANFFPDNPEVDAIEYTSLINIRPSVGNRSMEIKDPVIRNQVLKITKKLLP